MNQEKQPEAVSLAQELDCIAEIQDARYPNFGIICNESAIELRRLHARNTEQRAELVAEAARTAEEKLRADQMTEQHHMQCNMRKELETRVRQAEHVAHALALDKIALEAQLSAIGAGGVESLRKRDADLLDAFCSPGKGSKAARRMQALAAQPARECLQQSAEPVRGQSGFEAWWRDKYPSFACHAPGIWEMAMHHAALQSAPPAPQGEKVYAELPEPAATGLGDEYESFDRDGRAMGKAYETIRYFTADQMRNFADATADGRLIQAPAPAAVAVPADLAKRIKDCAAHWAYMERIDHGDQAEVEQQRLAELVDQLAATPAQEHATQLAGQGHDDLRTAALQDSAYAAGMLSGWNYCIADDHATFSKVRGERMTGAVRALKEARAAAPAQAQEDGQDAVRALIATHADMLEDNAYAYFELAYTRQTGWMVWITDKPGWCKEVLVNPDRKVLAQGQGDTPDEACADAARAAKGGT